MGKIINTAKKFLEAGFNIIPANDNKIATVRRWTDFQEHSMRVEQVEEYFQPNSNIAVLTGGKSRVVCLDADMKYDLSGDLWDRFKKEIPRKLLKKMYVQATQNNGFHFVFKAPSTRLFGNQKLAARPTTPDEQHKTYIDAFQNIDTKDKALKIALNDSHRILFETRSGGVEKCGGYFLIAPSKGYTSLFGTIQEITEEEYDLLIETARSFNQVKMLDKPISVTDHTIDWEVDPFDDFSTEGDALGVLMDNGWTVEYSSGRNVRLRRPGHTHAKSSGMYDKESKIFNCFSTSTKFDINIGYTGASVFTILEADGDYKEAYRKLIALGYGKRKN